MARGNAYVKYGKIEIGGEDIDKVMGHLKEIMIQFGYPEQLDEDLDYELGVHDDAGDANVNEDEADPSIIQEAKQQEAELLAPVKSEPWLRKPGGFQP